MAGTDMLLFRTAPDVSAGQRAVNWGGDWPPPERFVRVIAPVSREWVWLNPDEPHAKELLLELTPDWQVEHYRRHSASEIDRPAAPDERWFRGAEYVLEESQ